MMALLLPIDDNGHALPVLGFKLNGTRSIDVNASPQLIDVPTENQNRIITIVSTAECRFEIGDETVVANATSSPVLLPGIYLDLPIYEDGHYLSVVNSGEPCTVHVMERI